MKSCRDSNECEGILTFNLKNLNRRVLINLEGTSRCSHYCDNKIGSYKCSCDKGFTLEADEHACKLDNPVNFIFVYNVRYICFMFLIL